MSNLELSKTVKRVYLKEVKRSLDIDGKYWNSSIPRPTAKELAKQLKDNGYDVSFQEIKPVYEHVFFLPEYKTGLDAIAIERAAIMESEDDSRPLPI